MLEREVIQQRGFRNVHQGGKPAGFQVRFRLPGYRGIWLSMEEGFEVTVDGEKFSRDQVRVTVGGRSYTQDEMTKLGEIHWSTLEPAILTVSKPGGLKLGVHDVEILEYHRVSYIPYPPEGGAAPGSFGGPRIYKRRMVLVR